VSIKLMAAAWDSNIPSTEKMVLLCLCDFADDDGRNCYPSIATIAKKTSKNERTVQRALRLLEDAKILTSNGRSGTSTNYQINPRHFVRGDILSGVTKTTKGGGVVSPRGRQDVTLTTNEPPIEPPSKNIRARTFPKPDDVEQDVWEAFCRHRKKKGADISDVVMRGIAKQAGLAGWSLNDALAELVTRNWQSFKAEWVEKKNGTDRNQPDGMGRTERATMQAIRDLGLGDSTSQCGPMPPGGSRDLARQEPDALLAIGYDAGGSH
jgi:DNA-binding transcriptional ArsR family regulator